MQDHVETLPALSPDQVRWWREKLGMSQLALARALGVSKRTIEGYEAPRNTPASREPPAYLRLALERISLEFWTSTKNPHHADESVIREVREIASWPETSAFERLGLHRIDHLRRPEP